MGRCCSDPLHVAVGFFQPTLVTPSNAKYDFHVRSVEAFPNGAHVCLSNAEYAKDYKHTVENDFKRDWGFGSVYDCRGFEGKAHLAAIQPEVIGQGCDHQYRLCYCVINYFTKEDKMYQGGGVKMLSKLAQILGPALSAVKRGNNVPFFL